MSYAPEISTAVVNRRRLLPPLGAVVFAALSALMIGVLLLSPPSNATLPTTTLTSSTVADYQNTPLTNDGVVPPLVMLVMSRDEQLSVKAYTDYSDLNNDGVLDTTYTDNFDYGGYFDSNLCYVYSAPVAATSTLPAVPGIFKASAAATGTNLHQCNGSAWSGNFLNWLTMTRLDIVSSVLFGGKRAVDLGPPATTSPHTLLQRSYLPDDVHSFAKVYPPNGTAAGDINRYTPYAVQTSFCNTSDVNSATAYSATGYKPLLRLASGNFPQWATTEVRQCDWRNAARSGSSDQPNSTDTGAAQLEIFVDVCNNASARESFCRPYTSTVAGVSTTIYKPAGLIQQYGENGQLRFGLMTGTYDKPRSGGVLRKNIGLISKNDSAATSGCATGDEINFKTGQFCYAGTGNAGVEGIVNTVQRLQITQWQDSPTGGSGQGYTGCTFGAVNRSSSGLLGSPNRSATNTSNCLDWNNPLAEIYGEALRYIQGGSKTALYQPASNSIDSSLGLPNSVTWKPPYTSSNYCASCSIIVLSTGFGSFDTDEVDSGGAAAIPDLADGTAAAATTRLGSIEDSLAGTDPTNVTRVLGSDIIGYYGLTPIETGTTDVTNGATTKATCTPRNVADFALVRGICPEQPTREGGYYLAGLAFDAWTQDLIPTTAIPGTQRVETYAVALAETLPSLTLPTTGGAITISPICQNGYGDSGLRLVDKANDPGGTTCSLNDVFARPFTATSTTAPFAGVTYGLPTAADGKSGSLLLVWEDQPWGSDYDRDITVMLTYCVGSACSADADGNGRYDICEDKVLGPGNPGYTAVAGNNSAIPARGSICANTNRVPTTTNPFFGPNPSTDIDPAGGEQRYLTSTPSTGASYTPTVGSNQALVRIETFSASTGASMVAGFSANGSTQDGLYRPLLYRNFGGQTSSVITGQNAGQLGTAAQVFLLTSSNAPASNSLKNPLFYAAKYGGFTYNAGDAVKQPTSLSQWDAKINGTGANGTDKLPDNYFPVRNPSQLKTQLGRVLTSILSKSGSGTAAAVVANDRQGQGVIYQALYEPSRLDANDSNIKATWLGTLQTFFIDSIGRLREDGNGDGKLDEATLATDPAVVIGFDQNTRTQTATRDSGAGPTAVSPDSLKPIWNARKVLSALTAVTQRVYTSVTANTRYIFTFVDANVNGVADANEQVPFTAGSFRRADGDWGLLNTNSRANAVDIINYIRGTDGPFSNGQPSRNRTISYSPGDTPQVARLGDIINSSPTAVTAPAESFDLLYSDSSYETYFKKYRQRRQVVYVGANDGMLHAFNGGFYNPTTKTLALSNSGGTEAQHPLGTELWAYVPFNMLPHLTWLTDPDYPHVSYMDGKPRVFDARIFTADATHPGGWGTVLVAGFQFGGGPLTMTAPSDTTAFSAIDIKVTNSSGVVSTRKMTTGDQITTRPAYVVMDITDPEQAPTLIAEITAPTLGYTTSYPTVAFFKGTTGTESWYLVFGNGPETQAGTSTQNAGLYVYDLANKAFVSGFAPKALPGATTSFTGDPVSVDWELDYKANAVYVGSIGTPTVSGGAVTAQSGQLFKLNFNNANTPTGWSVSSLLNPGNPVIATPSVALDEAGRRYVFGGTGRFYSQADKSSTIQQSLFGVIDATDQDDPASTTNPKAKKAAPVFANLVDTTNAVVRTDGSVTGVSVGTTGVNSQTALISSVITQGGWKLNLPVVTGSAAQRNLNASALLGETLFITGYTPSPDQCKGDGASELYGLYYKSGAARADAPVFGLKPGTTNTVLRSYDLGSGLAASPGLRLNGSNAASAVTVLTQTSTGAIQQNQANLKSGVRSQEVDWRENHP